MSATPSSFVASIACALNSAHVPCVLWGQYLFQIFGVPTIVVSIDFVVPDDLLQVSIDTLSRIETLSHCQQGEDCLTSPQHRYAPPPAFHFHVGDHDSGVRIELFPQSQTLWFIPPLDESLLHPQKATIPPYLVLASDATSLPQPQPGRGRGVLPADEYPVILPRAHVFLQFYLQVYARDAQSRVGSYAMAMITYIEEYVDDDCFLDVELLPEPLRTSYKELGEGKKPVLQWTDELKVALGIQ